MEQPPITVLVTGFGPFPGAPFNPTPALVRALVARRRPAFAGITRIGHVFRTSYATVEKELPALLALHRPQVVLMFGLAARTPFLRIETCARNVRTGLLADASGIIPRSRRIVAGGPPILRGRAPFAALLPAVRRKVPAVRLSRHAGRYLCNFIYWRALEQGPDLVLFVHVPKLSHTTRPRRANRVKRLTAADLLRAGEVILHGLVAAARPRSGHRRDA